MEKKNNASSIVLAILFLVSAAVLVMFFCVGYGMQDTFNGNTYTAPQYTGLLLIWLYALVGICTASVFIFAIINGIKNLKYRKKGERKISFVAPVFFFTAVAIVASYFLAGTDPIRLGDQSLFENVSLLKLTDVCLYSIYALVVVAILSAFLSMIGVFKAKIKK
jgi:hypothetical protein